MAKERIVWTDEEWEKLADLVVRMRLNDPVPALYTLANKAMDSFPSDRRRKIQGAAFLGPLPELVSNKFKELQHAAEQAVKLQQRLDESRTAEEILESLSDTEIIRLYGERFLNTMTPEELLSQLTPPQILEAFKTETLVGEAARRFTEDLLNNPVIRQITIAGKPPVKQNLSPVKMRPPKVVFIGLKNNQQDLIRESLQHIADLRFVDKQRSASDVPKGADIYVVWTRFTSHDMGTVAKKYASPGCYIQHTGGIEKMVESVQLKLVEKFYNGNDLANH